jgi:hypothetical protein
MQILFPIAGADIGHPDQVNRAGPEPSGVRS